MLANLNNRGTTQHPEYATNFNLVEKYVMIRGMKDTMIWPNQGEWWQLPNEDPKLWTKEAAVEPMNETSLYKTNAFGLKDADEAGKIIYESSPGDHMQFTMPELYAWVDKYLM
jgi:palmitoyl-protein thioesterase